MRSLIVRPVLLLTLLVLPPGSTRLAAQELPVFLASVERQRAPTGADDSVIDPVSETTPAVLGALVGGAAGVLVGWYGGFHLTGGSRICGDDPCGFVGGLYGVLLGEFVGIGLGAHLGHGRRGQAGAAIGASFAALLLSGMLTSVIDAGDAWIVLVPAAQITAAVAAELASSR